MSVRNHKAAVDTASDIAYKGLSLLADGVGGIVPQAERVYEPYAERRCDESLI